MFGWLLAGIFGASTLRDRLVLRGDPASVERFLKAVKPMDEHRAATHPSPTISTATNPVAPTTTAAPTESSVGTIASPTHAPTQSSVGTITSPVVAAPSGAANGAAHAA